MLSPSQTQILYNWESSPFVIPEREALVSAEAPSFPAERNRESRRFQHQPSNLAEAKLTYQNNKEEIPMDVIALLTAFGLGSIITALVQAWLNTRNEEQKRKFSEKKEAYIGLLESYYQVAVNSTEANRMRFGYWQLRCELVGSKEVRTAVQAMIDSNEDKEGTTRKKAYQDLQVEMRKDLQITT